MKNGKIQSRESVKDRKNRPYGGYRNWDTAMTCIVLNIDKGCFDYVRKNGDRLLRMKKNDKLKILERESSYGYGFGGVSYRNVDYKELNRELKSIKDRK